jgi:rare lipoprotein A
MEKMFYKHRYSSRCWQTAGLITALMLLASCATVKPTRDGPPKMDVDVTQIKDAKPTKLAKSKYGNPRSYVVHGHRYYVLNSAKGYNKRGIASWYGTKFQGHLTSTREHYDLYSMTAASPELPIPSYVRVTNLENKRSIIVKVNDRGPFAPHRILDLSYVAAKKLGYMGRGTAMVQVTSLEKGQIRLAKAEHRRAHLEHLALHKRQGSHLADGRAYLQLGAFRSYANAKQLKIRVAHLTHRETIITARHAGANEIYRVQVGPFTGQNEKRHLQAELANRGLGHAVTITN